MSVTYDFDREIDRRDTLSVKWNRYRERDVLPMWVADTDFAVLPEIQQALVQRAAHPVFGYSEPPPRLGVSSVDVPKRFVGVEEFE